MRARKWLPWLALTLILALSLLLARPKNAGDSLPVLAPQPQTLEQRLERGEKLQALIRYSWQEYGDVKPVVYQSLRQLLEQRLAQQAAYAGQILEAAEFNQSLPEQGIYYNYHEELESRPAQKEYVSLRSLALESVYGAAHPMDYGYGFVFEAESGRLLSLEDIWGGEARERAATEIYEQIESAGQLDNFYPNLKENLRQNLGQYCWYMDEDNICIIYNPYEIAPYAAGVLTFKLPK